jgi:hypothetical protein
MGLEQAGWKGTSIWELLPNLSQQEETQELFSSSMTQRKGQRSEVFDEVRQIW